MPNTTNFGWALPDVGASDGAWGTILNTALGEVDADLDAVKDTADAALPKAGGTMTGRVDLHSATQQRTSLGTVTGAVALDLSDAQAFDFTAGAAPVLSVTNVPAGDVIVGLMLRVTNGGSKITWPATFRWPAGSAPALTSSGTDIVVAVTFDGGSSWSAWVPAQDLR
jgi:hypothetical protein